MKRRATPLVAPQVWEKRPAPQGVAERFSCEDTMEIGARRHHLQLLSSDPETCARFYARAYGMQVERLGSN